MEHRPLRGNIHHTMSIFLVKIRVTGNDIACQVKKALDTYLILPMPGNYLKQFWQDDGTPGGFGGGPSDPRPIRRTQVFTLLPMADYPLLPCLLPRPRRLRLPRVLRRTI